MRSLWCPRALVFKLGCWNQQGSTLVNQLLMSLTQKSLETSDLGVMVQQHPPFAYSQGPLFHVITLLVSPLIFLFLEA